MGELRARSRRLRLAVGVLLLLLGLSLALKPFASLVVLLVLVAASLVVAGGGELLRRDSPGGRHRRVGAGAHLMAAVVVLAWPGATIRVIAVAVAAALLVGGAADLLAARHLTATARYDAVVGGATSVVLGVLALAWPDVSVLVVAVLFGARVAMAGARLVVAGIRGDRVPQLAARRPRAGRRGGWLRLTGSVVGAAVAVVLVVVSVALQRNVPHPDAFYDTPEDVSAATLAQPGRLLRSEPFTSAEIPSGAAAWRILYTTTRDEGRPATASGLVIAPVSAVRGQGARPATVVAWAHGTTGFATGCAPSILTGGLAAGAMTIQDLVVERGWAMVATDYVGLGTPGPHPYLIGQGEGRSGLDAVRAAHRLTTVDLAEDTVVWGHSQGGHAALWAGILAPTYAPDVRVDGVVALAPASGLPGLVDGPGEVTGGALFAGFAVSAYAATYPDVRSSDVVRPGARILVDEMAGRCLAERSVVVSALTALSLDKPVWSGDPDSGAFGRRLHENVPVGPVEAPLLVAQGTADTLVVPTAQAAYVRARCRSGYQVDYRTYEGRGHVELVAPDSAAVTDLLAWTSDRFDDVAVSPGCSSTAR
ncbi:lipase family protein [Terracoccus luteus]|uniref:lipase family protein n=1 Tax=Terracoccus luteus TaxID=53356 RepID=UPI00209F3663|nr:lipase family protein [Terracoccus luteus]MCP2172872.1 uncharacterized membrane protein HdeD (DUF308 family) [Terracoccus luteus]